MNLNSQTFSSTRKPKNFNNPEHFIEGWYWVIPSRNLRVGEVKPVTILGRELVIYRGKDRRVVTFDAYCPHMGAHLAEGKVEGNALRCFFHHWKFDAEGMCIDIPCLDTPPSLKLQTWPTAEKYGMIWVWTGEIPQQPLPFVPELEQKECDVAIHSHFVINCHPSVVMINAIDAQHLNTVHKLPIEIIFERQELNENAMIFSNTTPIKDNFFFIKLIRIFYKNAITYSICYWYGSIGIVTLGPDFFHVHMMVAVRLHEGGKTEGQVLLMTKKRKGIFGWLYNRVVLWLTKIAAKYFLMGDIKILQTIQFDLKTPIKVDQPIMQFINHVEKQQSLMWGTWQEARSRDLESKPKRERWQDTMSND
ncbi:Phenylpropionate dioxygenase or related ring-hydroxylating dioxygenase, large terminal subunit [Nostoc flagelliforme CCNUN1]|uniref:Phenylpropionate dioxygenase or related ring-hydroxylating dioxygenase, large terminal subunit n=1 Tax=Nostoc flagelliforme CCNUN1 TaxID=2038116 RepID=A0A2K8SPB2_9NOSO|nr:aromatic ring-hydroxylating dioxygenase subunit alpha [Nostoc flagelliforme]AUB37292.1 Phenylpropionate dioxygenase or related ring-hydroxylating dioxygenase, large terminal subunit [Nostoc flagelliforme CCNUN1]